MRLGRMCRSSRRSSARWPRRATWRDGPADDAFAQASALVKPALETITERTVGFIEAGKAIGIAGIYYAVQWASYGDLSEAEYREFGEPYDRRILAAADDLPVQHGAPARRGRDVRSRGRIPRAGAQLARP